MIAKTAIVKTLQNFKLSPCEKTVNQIKFVPNSTNLSPGDVWLKLSSIHEGTDEKV